MSDQYGRDGQSGSNLGPQDRRGDPVIRSKVEHDVRNDFGSANTLFHEFKDEISQLSDDGRRDVEDILRATDIQRKRELSDQKRARNYRELSEQVRRYEELVRHPELKLGEMPFNGQAEIDHIKDASRQHVAEREKGYIDRIDRDARYQVSRAIREDHDRQNNPSLDRTPDRDHDPER